MNSVKILVKSYLERDYSDLQKLNTWLNNRSKYNFDSKCTNLLALDSRLIANKSISLDDAKNIGRIIQEILDNVALSNASIKRSQQAITLASLKPSVKVGSETVVIDPIVLFF